MGDNMETDKRWPHMRKRLQAFRQAHSSIDWLSLPDRGMYGNSHMLMMDRNSLEVADLVSQWLDAEFGK